MLGGGDAFIGWHMPGDPTKRLIVMKDVGVLSVYGSTGSPIVGHYILLFAFADCASTIGSGAMVGRTFSGVGYPVESMPRPLRDGEFDEILLCAGPEPA